jgi:hypothetical protein
MEEEFDLFLRDDKGPIFRGVVHGLEAAKRKAQEIANAEGFECFVFSLKDFRQVEILLPATKKPRAGWN